MKTIPVDEVLEAPSVEVDIVQESEKEEEPTTPKLGLQSSQEESTQKYFSGNTEEFAEQPCEEII